MSKEQITLEKVYAVVNRLEDKMDDRLETLENRINSTEGKLDTLLGKVGIGVIIITLFASAVITFVSDAIKKTFFK